MVGRVLGAVGVVALLGVVAAWQLGFLTPEPEEVSLADAVAAESETEASDVGQDDADGSTAASTTTLTTNSTTASTASAADQVAPCVYEPPAPAGDAATGPISDLGQLDGRWVIGQSKSTFAGYRIDEILSGADFTAVGRTDGVSGSITIESGTIAAAEVAVDLVGLTSDSRIRDEQLKRQALETSRFPTACFSLTEPIVIDGPPGDGEVLTVEASGSLHVHGVDQPVTIALESTTSDGLLFVVGSTEVALVDFAIDKPSAPSVADVSDTATMEFSLVLSRQT